MDKWKGQNLLGKILVQVKEEISVQKIVLDVYC